jgi:acetoin utilization deacetylase AcuC-like enzyme
MRERADVLNDQEGGSSAFGRQSPQLMKVVYGPEMVAELLHHISPSSSKPKVLVDYLSGLGYPVEMVPPVGLSREQIALAHQREYVDDVLDGRLENGFGTCDQSIAKTLPFTSGSLWVAAQVALEEGIAASFSSGFHHARYAMGGGFCTFNGLVICARLLNLPKTLILDLDYHYGDGTDEILRTLKIEGIRHETFGIHYLSPDRSQDYLDLLDAVLSSLEDEPVDLILYQAGADAHIDDPLGGLLTADQMEWRDRAVFGAAKKLGIPIAWNLAGGYQRDQHDTILPVLQLHEITYRSALEIFRPHLELPVIEDRSK